MNTLVGDSLVNLSAFFLVGHDTYSVFEYTQKKGATPAINGLTQQ